MTTIDLTVLIVGGLLGLISLIIGITIAYWQYKNSLSLMIGGVEKAEHDFLEDIKRIGLDELEQTKSGRELLKLLDPETKKELNSSEIIEDKKADFVNFVELLITDVTDGAMKILQLVKERSLEDIKDIDLQRELEETKTKFAKLQDNLKKVES